MHYWSDADVQRVVDLLPQYRVSDFPRLMQRLSEDFGRRITQDQVQKVLRRRGLGPMTSLCKQGGGSRHEVGTEYNVVFGSAPEVPTATIMESGAPGFEKIWAKYGDGRKREEKTSTPQPIKLLCLPDTHVPYHDVRAWNVMLNCAHIFQPSILVHLGDLADNTSVSRHLKSADKANRFDWEMEQVNLALDQLDAIPSVKRRVLCEGNHETMITRAAQERFPEVASRLQIKDILRLNERGWEFIPHGQCVKIGRTLFTHDTGYHGARAHIQSQALTRTNTVVGHCHAAGIQYVGAFGNENTVAISGGWLGDKTKIDYMSSARTSTWQLAFVIGFIDPRSDTTHFQLVPIIDYVACINGQFVSDQEVAA